MVIVIVYGNKFLPTASNGGQPETSFQGNMFRYDVSHTKPLPAIGRSSDIFGSVCCAV